MVFIIVFILIFVYKDYPLNGQVFFKDVLPCLHVADQFLIDLMQFIFVQLAFIKLTLYICVVVEVSSVLEDNLPVF